ncbi:hypothetical protein LWI29_002040 [Acer saccharum]|uniref:Uncharacterized protein n=1 Tax=Acer saccharum TaxID=4024 RepID=A0AA39T0B9_ACESA|nr:hypothetical protein LWI29_002040 [Acer saccharum]
MKSLSPVHLIRSLQNWPSRPISNKHGTILTSEAKISSLFIILINNFSDLKNSLSALTISRRRRLRSHAEEIEKMKFVKPLNLYELVLKKSLKTKHSSPCSSFLAMNVGTDSVSLAHSSLDYTTHSSLDYTTAIYGGTIQIAKSEEFMPIMVRMFQNVIKAIKAEGLIVGYPYISFKEKPNGAEIENFIDKLDKTGKFGGLKYTYWSKNLESKIHLKDARELCVYPNAMGPCFYDPATKILQGYLNCVRMAVADAKLFEDAKLLEDEPNCVRMAAADSKLVED